MEEPQLSQKIRNVHIRYYAAACDTLGIPYTLDFNTRMLRMKTLKGNAIYCYRASTPLNLQASVTLAKDKHVLHRYLEPAGFPVPKQIKVKSVDEDLLPFFKEFQKIVVKPSDAHGGIGVTVLPKEQDLVAAFERAKRSGTTVIAEEYITGNNYRFLVLGNKVIAISLRLPPLVRGDGRTDLATLISDYNLENKALGLPKVPDSPYTLSIIQSQGFTLESVPPMGKEVLLRLTANLSLGGTIKDVSATCDESYKKIAVDVAKHLNLRLVGIDIISPYIDKPNAPAYVIEANPAPGMRIHYKDPEGAKLKVAEQIVSAMTTL